MSDKIISKSRYMFSLLGMCAILILVAYFFFLRTVEVNLTRDIKLVYTGENGLASLKVESSSQDLNQRIQEFMDSVSYTAAPDTDLSNGDIVTIEASYSKQLADAYHFEPVNQTRTIVVEGLFNRYETLQEIPEDYVDDVMRQMDDYIMANKNQIYEACFDSRPSSQMEISKRLTYLAFLKSKSKENDDKLIGIYSLSFREGGQTKQARYLVCMPSINDSKSLDPARMYGEKAYLSNSEEENENFSNYITRIYSSKYTITQLESPGFSPDQALVDIPASKAARQ